MQVSVIYDTQPSSTMQVSVIYDTQPSSTMQVSVIHAENKTAFRYPVKYSPKNDSYNMKQKSIFDGFVIHNKR